MLDFLLIAGKSQSSHTKDEDENTDNIELYTYQARQHSM